MYLSFWNVFLLHFACYFSRLIAIEVTLVDNFWNHSFDTTRTFFGRFSGLKFACTCPIAACNDVSIKATGETATGKSVEHNFGLTENKLTNVWTNKIHPVPLFLIDKNGGTIATFAYYTCVFDNNSSIADVFKLEYRECLLDEHKECNSSVCIAKRSMSKNAWSHCQPLTSTDCKSAHENLNKNRSSLVHSISKTYSTLCDAVANLVYTDPPLYEAIGDGDLSTYANLFSFGVTVKDFHDPTKSRWYPGPLGSTVINTNISDYQAFFGYNCMNQTRVTICFNDECDKAVYCESDQWRDVTAFVAERCTTFTTGVLNFHIVTENDRLLSAYFNVVCSPKTKSNLTKTCACMETNTLMCSIDKQIKSLGISRYDRSELLTLRFDWWINGILLMITHGTSYSHNLTVDKVGNYNCVILWRYTASQLMYEKHNWPEHYLFSDIIQIQDFLISPATTTSVHGYSPPN